MCRLAPRALLNGRLTIECQRPFQMMPNLGRGHDLGKMNFWIGRRTEQHYVVGQPNWRDSEREHVLHIADQDLSTASRRGRE